MEKKLGLTYVDQYTIQNQAYTSVFKFTKCIIDYCNYLLPMYLLTLFLFYFMNIINMYEIMLFIFSITVTMVVNVIYCKLDLEYVKNFKNIFEKVQIKNTTFNKQIKEKKEEIKKVDDGNDFISEYIDAL